MHTGCPMHIITRIPHQRELVKGDGYLSDKARKRLAIIKWYLEESSRFSSRRKRDAKLTCRHFGLHSSYFHRWYSRYRKGGARLLEDRSRRPHRKRGPVYNAALVGRIREIRRADPTWSPEKIRILLQRDMGQEGVPSRATLGRIIRRYNMFYRADIISHRRRAAKRMRQEKRRCRVPYGMRADRPGEVVEFDMKHINLPGKKLYAMCGIDQYSRQAVVHICSNPSSSSARDALRRIVWRFGSGITIVNDNGSENKDRAEDWLRSEGITQLWARPHRPKDKPFIERFIGTLQRECLDYNYAPMDAVELQDIVDRWLVKYETVRPHEALGFLTPAQYTANYYMSQHSPVS